MELYPLVSLSRCHPK